MSGTITIPEINQYESIFVCFGNDVFGRREIEIFKNPFNDFFIGGDVYVSANSIVYVSLQIIVNENTLSIGASCYGRQSDGRYATTVPITRIVGGLKKVIQD